MSGCDYDSIIPALLIPRHNVYAVSVVQSCIVDVQPGLLEDLFGDAKEEQLSPFRLNARLVLGSCNLADLGAAFHAPVCGQRADVSGDNHAVR